MNYGDIKTTYLSREEIERLYGAVTTNPKKTSGLVNGPMERVNLRL